MDNPLDDVFKISGSKFDDVLDSITLLSMEEFPDTANLSLVSWERNLGVAYANGMIPDIFTRRTAIVAAMRARGGASRAYFETLSLAWGYTISITESTSAQFIIATYSSTSVPTGPATLLPNWIYDPNDQYYWTIHYGNGGVHDQLYEAYMQTRKPAHTVLTFLVF